LALEGEGRITRDDEEPLDAREACDDVFDHTIGEIFLLRIAAHVLEGQHSNRRLVRQRKRCRGFFQFYWLALRRRFRLGGGR
jgi:hypothetical protein